MDKWNKGKSSCFICDKVYKLYKNCSVFVTQKKRKLLC